MRFYFKYIIYLFVLIGFNLSFAGSYEDFFKAIELDQPEIVSGLLARGFDPNSPSNQGMPALLLAYQKKAVKVLDVLIAAKPTNLNVVNSNGENLLMLAAINNQLALVEQLIEKGTDINKPGWTALHYAASKGHIEMIRLLLDNQAYIDAESPNGTTPLMMAARYGSPKAVKLLLEEGADPRIRNQAGYDALQMAQKQATTDSAVYVQSFLIAWNEKYSNTVPQALPVDSEESPGVQQGNISIEPLADPGADPLPSGTPSVETSLPETITENGSEKTDGLDEPQTGAPLVLPVIETAPVMPVGEAEVREIRAAPEVQETDIANSNPVQITPIDDPAPEPVPYTRQIRSRAVVTIEVPGDPLDASDDTDDQ